MLKASQEPVNGFASSNGIDLKFSPAYSPNFGGLWEAGVKAAKFHLKRVVGSSNLTFEELTTLFTQVEAILNSRPLTPLSSDPSDLSPLTPGHFLIGRPLASLPSPPTQKMNLNRYHHLEALRQHFWKRWTREFLSDLQQRVKWRATGQGVKLGDLVILKDDNLPPLKWSLGRVETLHPGSDGVTRVVDVRTGKGLVRRAVSKLCSLPSNQEDDDQATILKPGGFKAPEDVNANT
ncbi:uncharacterized protein LOC133530418 [Cydia pomonella]|uniref:uncharacterized protein LOC133530418 n=1 Tax=Cydia pomonella TaxID=82600 RepID=UPI002ADD5EE0|nr:uncharacterized protein LOC133530418 [Cydia pomonella]